MLRKNCNVVARKIHGSFFLIDISDNFSDDKCALYEINETGMFIFDCINGMRTLDDLVNLLQEAIVDEVEYHVLYEDVVEFVDSLRLRGFVEG